jgi:SAM-dependent methyltransferase
MTSGRCPACLRGGTGPLRPTTYPEQPQWYRCAACATEFLFPQPTDARLAEIYGPAYYEPWEWESQEVVQASKERTFLRALSIAGTPDGARLLDVGCAQGEFAATAAGAGYKVAGVDLNPDAIARAGERVPEATFYCGELDPEVVGSGFDVVTMFDFIEHVRDPRATLSAASRVLVPGGSLLISTPRTGSAVHRLAGRQWPQYREEHLVLFSEEGLRGALASAGFAVERLVPTTKYCTGAYLVGQTAAYAPPAAQRLAQRARPALRAGVAHRLLPLRFGEMTVLATLT